MLRFDTREFFLLSKTIQSLAGVLGNPPPGQEEAVLATARKLIPLIREHLKKIGLEVSEHYVEDQLSRTLAKADVSINRVLPPWEQLPAVIEAECKTTLVLYVPKRDAEYFETKELFGTTVAGRFPGAIEDIAEAGNCYALGRCTAAVFHLMRVIEIGIVEVAHSLGIPRDELPDNWWAMIEKVRAEAERQAGQPEGWKILYAQVTTNLHSIRIAWRNETMHPKTTYTAEEAQNILGATRAFMQHLAEAFAQRDGQS